MKTETYTWLVKELTSKRVTSVALFGDKKLETVHQIVTVPTLQSLSVVESDTELRRLLQNDSELAKTNLQLYWGSLIYYDPQWKRQDAVVVTNAWYAYELPRLERILHILLHDYFPKYLMLLLPEEESGWTKQQFHQLCFQINLHNIYYIQFETLKDAHATITYSAVFTRKEPPKK